MPGRGDNNKRGSSGRGASGENNKPEHRTLNLMVDGTPYVVRAEPFFFNGEQRFNISVNGSEQYVFTWDSDLKRIRAIDDDSSVLPEAVEEAISDRLQSRER